LTLMLEPPIVKPISTVMGTSLCRRHHPNYLNIIVFQRDRFQRSSASHFQQRRDVLITNAAVETDVGLDGRTSQVAIEDRLGRLQAHARSPS
jgi:hypothetical protein